ncbi:DUF4147 domain-containing protein, partial [Ectothiorhodospiraceae bacterium WFHF3C12]|nr:DUF4147 domain-containing protein [Ectothiorhodospiraceae bacterium WFHF3C12]
MALTDDLLAAYRAALRAVDGAVAVDRALRCRPVPGEAIAILAVGKAAAAMSRGALGVLGERVSRGLVVCPRGYAGDLDAENIRVLESSHPVPDASSVVAGEAATAFMAALRPGEHLLVLISGGTSSLLELPVAGVSVEALSALNGQLLAEGYDIATMNGVRKALSRIKGGRLGRWLDGRPATLLAISDVPGNALHVIGSGPLHPDPEPGRLPPELARRVRDLAGGRPNPAPKPNDPCLAGVESHVVADNDTALTAAARQLREAGYRVDCPGPFLTGEVGDVAGHLAGVLTGPSAGDAVLVWGGEPTVQLPDRPGRGGRMHALA